MCLPIPTPKCAKILDMTEYKSHYMVKGVEFSSALDFEVAAKKPGEVRNHYNFYRRRDSGEAFFSKTKSLALSPVEKEWLGQWVKTSDNSTLEGVVVAQAPKVGSVWVFYPGLQDFRSHPCKNLVKVGISEREPQPYLPAEEEPLP